MGQILTDNGFSTGLCTGVAYRHPERLKSSIKGQNKPFCPSCQRKTCLKTKKICARLEKFMAKNIDVKFWHGVESYLSKPTFDFMQDLLYSFENKRDIKDSDNSIHI